VQATGVATGSATVRPQVQGVGVATGSATVRPQVQGVGVATGSATVRPQAQGVGVAAGNATGPLTCRLVTGRAPAGGLVSLQGIGFNRSAVVRVGSNIVPVVSASARTISARVPRGMRSGGRVQVTVGGRAAACGNLTIIGR
jgi:hypothetical protein